MTGPRAEAIYRRGVEVLAFLAALYHLVVVSRIPTFFGFFLPTARHRAVSLSFALVIVYLSYSIRGKRRLGISWFDALMLVLGMSGLGFVVFFYEQATDYEAYGFLDFKGMVLAYALAISILEALRRLTGWVLPSLIVLFLLAARYQSVLPGLLFGKGYTWDRLGYAIYVPGEGVFGVPLGVASTIVIVFLMFASMLQRAGVGEWFSQLALSLAGWTRGGPAKTAVLASAFFGTISGSPSANAATTGAFTIPLMIRSGYSPAFAGAVEAAASVGGQILPPVMGAIAFVMADFLGVPYAEVAKAAALPAVLYFMIVFMGVDFEAAKRGLKAIPRSELPATMATLKEGWYFLLPIGLMIYLMLVKQWDPDMAGIFSLPILVAVSFFSRDKQRRLYPSAIYQALVESVQTWLLLAVLTGAVGMLVAALGLSGLGIKFSRFLVDLSGGNLLAALAMVGVGSLILGMSMDSLPAYITVATLSAPALILMGVPDIAAHLFVVYWGLASHITPPVCITVYVTCGISGAGIWETGREAVRLAIGKYVLPFSFALNPALLLLGPVNSIVMGVVSAFAGAVSVSSGTIGYGLRRLGWIERALLIIGGVLLILPGWRTLVIGATLVGISLLMQSSIFGLRPPQENIPPAS
ncbi:MAG: TRAP transporter fused permease subunit [Deltaproteobacteria bacterium]|nr:TRAP transporter fused permease subunit [Deltaproteobacteria bacterium]MDZ4345030.1 TRAP transporter fused permease subunit [Candidatus Binatia bacterium]